MFVASFVLWRGGSESFCEFLFCGSGGLEGKVGRVGQGMVQNAMEDNFVLVLQNLLHCCAYVMIIHGRA